MLSEVGDMEETKTEITIETRAITLLRTAQDLVIQTETDRISAGDALKMIKSFQKEVKADREEERLAAKALADAITAARNRHLDPLEKAEKLIKQKVLAYEEAEERKRLQEQKRLNDLAAQQEDARLAEAMALEEMGAEEEAEMILDQPAPPPVIVEKTTPKVEGQHFTVRWKAEGFDLMETVKAVAAGKVPVKLLQLNQVFANSEATRLKDEFTKEEIEARVKVIYPGVKAVGEKTMASRSW